MAASEEEFKKAVEEAARQGPVWLPDSPVNEYEQLAISYRGAMDAYLGQNFTPAQALYLAAVMHCGNPGIAPHP